MTAVNAETIVSYIEEVTAGTTPATPAFQQLRVTGETLNVDRSISFSSELDGRRGQKAPAVDSQMGSGGLTAEFTDGSFEDLIAGALRSDWSTDVITDANTPKFFTLETIFEDGATDIYKRLTGAEVASMSLEMRAGQRVGIGFEFMARNGSYDNAAIASSTYVAGNTEAIETGASVANLAMTGVTVGCVPSLTLGIANNMTPEYCLGSLGPQNMAAGALEVTGSMQMFLTASQYGLLQKYEGALSTSLDFDVGETSGKVTQFSMPNVVLENLRVQSTSADGSVLIETDFRAIQATSLSGKVIEITRNAG